MLDCDQFQSESDQRGDIRSQDSRSRMPFRIVWQFNSCRHQDRLGKQQVTTRSNHGRHIGQAAIEGLIVRYMQQHVHARDETPLRLDFFACRLGEAGHPCSQSRSSSSDDRSMIWTVTEARAHFSALIDAVEAGVPATVRRDSRRAAVVELTLHDGQVLRTRISHPPNRQAYGPSMCGHILRDQLHVGEDEFWACAQEKKVPQRGRGEPTTPSIPAGVVALTQVPDTFRERLTPGTSARSTLLQGQPY